ALARQALPLTRSPSDQADLGQVLGLAEIRRGRPPDALPLLLGGAREIASSDPAKALELLLDAYWAAVEAGAPAPQVRALTPRATIEPPQSDDVSRFAVDLLAGLGAVAEGDLLAAGPRLERVLTWAARAQDPRLVVWAGSAAMWLGDPQRAQILLERGASLA